MDIRKVKLAGDNITIRGEQKTPDSLSIRRVEVESDEEARPEFYTAMRDLIRPALTMLDAPINWQADAKISGVSITYEEDRGMGAVVTVLVPLACAPSPLVVNTPYLPSEDPNGVGAPVLPSDLRRAIERVIIEAALYLDGERAQVDMFRGAKGDENSITITAESARRALDAMATA